MNTESALQKIGLTEKESVVYITLLKIKNGSLIDIAKTTNLPKSTIDDTLQKLVGRGFVKIYKHKTRKRYTAVSPEIVKKTIEDKLASITTVLPQLNAMFGSPTDRPVVHFYEGEWGLEKVLQEILSEADVQYGILSPDKLFPSLPKYFPEFSKKRVEKKIFSYLIFTDSTFARERHETDKEMFRESKVIDVDFGLDAMILMWQQKVAIITYEANLSVLVVESKSIRTAFEKMFDMIWKFVPEA